MSGVSEKVREAGNSIASHLLDAACRFNMSGLGGCADFHLDDFPENERGLIESYVNGEIDSVTAIFLHMKSVEEGSKS